METIHHKMGPMVIQDFCSGQTSYLNTKALTFAKDEIM